MEYEAPKLINVETYLDDRGCLSFCNTLDFSKIKRFYKISHVKADTIRAYHGHEREGKYLYVLSGSCLVGVFRLNYSLSCWQYKWTLSDKKPQILWVPPGHANGFMNLSQTMELMIFSTSSLEESRNDDLRLPYDSYDIWKPDPR